MKKRVPVFLFLLLFPLKVLASQSGWIEKNGYYKPYVKVKTNNCLVLFITEKGKVYRGKCRKNRSVVTPGKKFFTKSVRITYVILKLEDFSYPKVIETGEITE